VDELEQAESQLLSVFSAPIWPPPPNCFETTS
jgi:hypothetical protein